MRHGLAQDISVSQVFDDFFYTEPPKSVATQCQWRPEIFQKRYLSAWLEIGIPNISNHANNRQYLI